MSVEVARDGKYVVILSGDIEVVGMTADVALLIADEIKRQAEEIIRNEEAAAHRD